MAGSQDSLNHGQWGLRQSQTRARFPEEPAYLYLTRSLQVEDLIKRLLHGVTESNHSMVS